MNFKIGIKKGMIIMFSKKYIATAYTMLQKDDMDKTLRNDLWNAFQKYFLNRIVYISSTAMIGDCYSTRLLEDCVNQKFIIDLYENFFILPIGNMIKHPLSTIKDEIASLYNDLQWYQVYDLIEYISTKVINYSNFESDINLRLERNNSAYRLIKSNICPITNKEEIETIKHASNTTFDIVNTHINKAIQLFSNIKNPDYENVIKESITAVETMCSIIVGQKTTLGEALKKLEDNGVSIHPSLKSSFSKLYGYTSDANGIRHSGDIGGPESTFSEAKFMLISCSAFVNYLLENYTKITKN